MRPVHHLGLLFILSLSMVLCKFCNRSFGDQGLQTHTRKCPVHLERLLNAAAHAAEKIAAEAENLATASTTATAAAAMQLDFAADEVKKQIVIHSEKSDSHYAQLMTPPPREPSPPPQPYPSSHACRIRLPVRYRDELPDPPTPVPPQAPPPEPEPEPRRFDPRCASQMGENATQCPQSL
jgi:hypothetical protein